VIGAILESGIKSRLTLISGAVYLILLTLAYFVIKSKLKTEN
jgi:hypothetical protein